MSIINLESHLWEPIFKFYRSRNSRSNAIYDFPDKSSWYLEEHGNTFIIDSHAHMSFYSLGTVRLALNTNPRGFNPCKLTVKNGVLLGWVNFEKQNMVLYYLIYSNVPTDQHPYVVQFDKLTKDYMSDLQSISDKIIWSKGE